MIRGLLHGAGAGLRGAGGIQRLRGKKIGCAQGFGARAFLLRQLQGRSSGAGIFLRHRQRGLGGARLRLRLRAAARIQRIGSRRLDFRNHLPRLDGVAGLQRDASQRAAHRRRDDVAFHHPGLALLLDRDDERPALDRRDVDRHRTRHEAVDEACRDQRRDGQHAEFCAHLHVESIPIHVF